MTDKEQRAPPREPAPVSSRARPSNANSDGGSDIDTSAQKAPSIRTPSYNRPSEHKADSDINSDVESVGKPPDRAKQADTRPNMKKQVIEDEEEIPRRRAAGSAAGVGRRASSLTGSRQSVDGARDSTNDFNMPRSSETRSRNAAGEQDVLDRDSFDDLLRSKDPVAPAARRSGDVDDVKATSLEPIPIQAGPRVASGDGGVRKSVPRQQSDLARSVEQGRQSSAGDEDYEDESLSESRMASNHQGQGVRRSQSNQLQHSGNDDQNANDGDGRVRDRKAAASKLVDGAGNSVGSTGRKDDSEGHRSSRGVRQSQQAEHNEQPFQEESFDIDEGHASSIEDLNSKEDIEDEDGYHGKTSSARRSKELSSRPSNPLSAAPQNRESQDAARRSQSKGAVDDADYAEDGRTPKHQQSRAGKPPRTRQVPSDMNEYNDEVPLRRNKSAVHESSRAGDAEYSSDQEDGFPNTLGSRSLDGARSQSGKARSAAHADTREVADEAEEEDSPIKGSRDRKGRLKSNTGDAGSTYRPSGIPNDQGPEINRANLPKAAPAQNAVDDGLDKNPPSRARPSKLKDGQERKQQQQQQEEEDDEEHMHGRDEAPLVQDLERAFQGDVSHWGRTDMPEYYDEEADGSQANMSIATMSSGLSPRDTRPRLQPFDYEKATKALQYQSGLYARAQTMRRDGTAPAAAGITDDLPTRIAYQQLNMLAGMAGKVQDAILHNKKVFEQRMVLEDRAGLKRAFQAWRAARYGSIAKQNKLRKACARISKGMLSRAFYTWKDKFPLCDNSNLMKRKVAAIVARGMRRRCFLEWKRLCEDRWWKTQHDMRDRQIILLENKIRGYERRPILVLRKRRLKEMLKLWKGQVDSWTKKKKRLNKACSHFKNMQYTKAWHSWMDVVHESRRRRGLLRKAVLRINNIAILSSWNKWRSQAETRKRNHGKLKKAVLLWTNASLSKAWSTWLEYLEWKKKKQQIIQRWMNPQKARALAGWYEQAQWKMRMKLILNRTAQRLSRAALAIPFYTWLEEAQTSITSKTIEGSKQTMITYETELKQLRAENERLQRDNERFVRLIDSGEWGRGRVAELVQAGEVLKGERDALFKLINSLRHEYDSVQQAKAAQDDELQKMKEKMLLGGHARNRMLIKGGSSFNALVRAMKQDLVEARHQVQKDPNLLYEIDKLSMDHVQVFPDGELNIQAVTTAPNAAAFSRPVSTGRHRSSTGSTAKFRSPTSLQSMVGQSGPSSSLPSSPTKLSRNTKGGSSGVGGPETITSVLTALKGLTPVEQDQLKALLQQHKDSGQVPGSPTAPQARARAT